jgi:hypothetical protein
MPERVAQAIKSIAGAVVLAVVPVAGSVQGEPMAGGASPVRFSVVQWNIGHFAMGKDYNTTITANDSAKRSAEYRAMIDRMKPDFLGISEYDPVFDKVGRSTVSELFSAFPTKVIGPKNAYQSNAIFTRFKCVRHEVVNYTKRKQNTYFIDSVFMFGTNEVHFVQSHLDWYTPEGGECFALPQMRQLVERFKNTPYVIISADFNVWKIGDFSAFANAGYTIANRGQYALLDNVVVKGFNVKELSAYDREHNLSDHTIIGCVLEMPALKVGWVEEKFATAELTGRWSEPLSYDGKTMTAEVLENVFTPFSESGGNVTTFDVTVAFDLVPEEQETPSAGQQGSLWLGTNGCFQVWSLGGWVDVAADGVTPAIGVDYTFRFKFDYRYGVYSVAVSDGGVMKPLVAASGTPLPAGTARFPLAGRKSGISSVTFAGGGVLTSLIGEYGTKAWFNVIVR